MSRVVEYRSVGLLVHDFESLGYFSMYLVFVSLCLSQYLGFPQMGLRELPQARYELCHHITPLLLF